MEIKILIVKETTRDQFVTIEHIKTEYMFADALTKALPACTYSDHSPGMNLVRFFKICFKASTNHKIVIYHTFYDLYLWSFYE